MAITETIATWVMEQFADRAFSSVIDKVKDFALSKMEKNAIEEIRQIFFEKYSNEPFYDNLDSYITLNQCIEVAVRLAGSINPKDQRLFSQFVSFHTRKFIEQYPQQKYLVNSIRDIFELIKQTAIIKVNLSSDLETRKLQVSIVQGTEEIKSNLENTSRIFGGKLEQLPLQIVNAVQDAYRCDDSELQLFFDKVEYIKENFQKNRNTTLLFRNIMLATKL